MNSILFVLSFLMNLDEDSSSDESQIGDPISASEIFMPFVEPAPVVLPSTEDSASVVPTEPSLTLSIEESPLAAESTPLTSNTTVDPIPSCSGICTRRSRSGVYKSLAAQTRERKGRRIKSYCTVTSSEANWKIKIDALCSDKPGFYSMSFPGYYSNNWSNLVNVEIPEDTPHLPYAQLIRGRLNYDREQRAAVRRVEQTPVNVKCAYCGHQCDTLKALEQHVVGRRGKKSGDNQYWRIDCIKRKIDEGISEKYPYDKIPLSVGKEEPKKKIWAIVNLQDESLRKEDGSFDIPATLKEDWYAYFKQHL